MDRTGRIVVFICVVLLIGMEFALEKFYPSRPQSKASAVTASASTNAAPSLPEEHVSSFQSSTPTPAPSSPSPTQPVAEKVSTLENDALKVTLTSKGAAIQQVELKKHKEGNGHVMLNQQSRTGILELSGWPGADTANFQVTENPGSVVYSTQLPNGVKWERSYAFGQAGAVDSGLLGSFRVFSRNIATRLGRPVTPPLVYTLDVKETLTNTGTTDVTLPDYSLSIGRAEPLLVDGHYQAFSNIYLGSGWLTAKFRLTTINDFNPGYIPLVGIKTRDAKDVVSSLNIDNSPLRWLGVENQFFAVLLTPAQDRGIQHAEFRCYNQRDPDGNLMPPSAEPDIEAAAFFPEIKIPVGQSVAINYSVYAGPKEFNRLDALGADQGELMNYDGLLPFSLLIVPMLTVLHFWNFIFHSYGIAIILLTLIIKAITWPLQSIANRSGKRMQALAPKIKEMQAKYKDQPEKLNTETFALYREYGVNPLGGCLPALVQMPVFFSLYFMLQNAVELRGQHFLWVRDLTQPDNIFTLNLLGFPLGIHPLPIMVTALTMVMMRMTPQIGDPQQAKIAQYMPLIFLFLFYNFAAALSLYYVINNCVSIIQIYRNVRKPLPELKRVPRKK
ncbi:MAG: YidC/Oxa1 family insertase periplasmic-domain containing protein [Methylacidiphilales bacterium]|nr:YidC/Oxa1 family insertase periplasmic-domain containing protein [Candidatus Methylacidiphilales bacterium]